MATSATLSNKHFPTDRPTHTRAFDAPIVDHWLEWKITQPGDASAGQDRLDDTNLYRWVRYRQSYGTFPLELNAL